MVKRLSVSVDDWIWDRFFIDYKGNRSSFLIKYFIRGIELEDSDVETIKKKLIQIQQENINLRNENRELKNKLERFRKGEKQLTDEERVRLIKMMKYRAVKLSGINTA